jgi:hypothetical protein
MSRTEMAMVVIRGPLGSAQFQRSAVLTRRFARLADPVTRAVSRGY